MRDPLDKLRPVWKDVNDALYAADGVRIGFSIVVCHRRGWYRVTSEELSTLEAEAFLVDWEETIEPRSK